LKAKRYSNFILRTVFVPLCVRPTSKAKSLDNQTKTTQVASLNSGEVCPAHLLVSLLLVADVEVAQVVGDLGVSDDANEVAQLVLLEELLGQVLQVALGELVLGHNGDLLALLGNRDQALQLTGLAAVDLDAVVQVLLLKFTSKKK
jgi:hypothetical protein